MKNRYPDSILQDQISYYKARASEYDEWFLRMGRFDRGADLNRIWFWEVEELKNKLKKFHPAGEVLELAGGTGWWTGQLVQFADHITAVDASSEAIKINKKKTGGDKVTYIKADLFNWLPSRKYDVVFFSFWLSHVPTDRFDQFWKLVRRAIKPNGRVFFIDSLKSEGLEKAGTINNLLDSTSLRKLNDGRTFKVIKVFFQPEKLAQRLKHLGWDITVKHTNNYFIYGFGNIKKVK